VRRHFQKAVAPAEFPPAMRARLDAVHWNRNIAERFRREEIFHAYRPKLAEALAADHLAIAGATDRWYSQDGRACHTYADAYLHTRRQHVELSRAHLGRAFDEQEIRDYADNYARACAQMKSREHREAFCRFHNVEPPDGPEITPGGASARMDDALWWRKRLRANWTRRAENVMRETGIVRKGREPYASDDAVRARASMKARARKFLEKSAAVNEQGEQLELLKVAERSTANPRIRRGEFMVRVRGFEEIAREAGHVAQFWTLTAPSAFHAHLSEGRKNPNFAGQCVRDAQAWLCKQWSRARAKLRRLSILLYGFRIAEPHHDATPHWHMLLFVRPGDAATIETVVRGYWLAEYADERGAREYRAKCEAIDPAKGSAAGYIAKYVSKNIDGAGTIGEDSDDETGAPVIDGVRRVDAWASLHAIRQFQQIGGPPVGLWRELRRLRDPVERGPIERARVEASDKSSFSGLVRAVGGIEAGRNTTVRVWKSQHGGVSRYGDVRGPLPIGLMCGALLVRSRSHVWRIVRQGQDCGADAIARRQVGPHRPGDGLLGTVCNPNYWPGRSKRQGRGRKAATESNVHRFNSGASGSVSSIFSDLGPVAITVRGHIPAPARARDDWHTWDAIAERWHRAHGRYPTLQETIELSRKREASSNDGPTTYSG
jgi:hypothetical protein